MEAEIPASNLKVFTRALYLLHKIGQAITIETSAERLIFRALSPAESAYAQVAFSSTFFTHYQPHPQPRSADDATTTQRSMSPSFDAMEGTDDRHPQQLSSRSPSPTTSTVGSTLPLTLPPRFHTVQVNSKLILVPFRSALSQVKRVTLHLCASDSLGFSALCPPPPPANLHKRRRPSPVKDLSLMVQLHYEEQSLTKTYRLPTLEQACVMQPNFSRQSCPTLLGTKAKRLSSLLSAFPECDELALTCHPSTVSLSSFLDWAAIEEAASLDQQLQQVMMQGGKGRAKAMKMRKFVQTESQVSSDEFGVYDVKDECMESAMVFTLAEVRQFCALGEVTDEELFLFAVQPGQPVLLTNTRKPFMTAGQQRAMRERREEEREEEGEAMGATIPPSPRSTADSQWSYHTSDGVEQTQRTWSGELILATLEPSAAMRSSQDSQQGERRGAGGEDSGGGVTVSPSPVADGG